MRELEYPFDAEYLIKKKKAIKKTLLEEDIDFLDKKIAILGGSTTGDVKQLLEIFLLNQGIRPTFYESEYNKFYEDAMFENPELDEFAPDIIYVYTTNRNINVYPKITDSLENVEELLDSEYKKFEGIWESLKSKYNCPIIQNNFEYPFYRLLGNKDASSHYGRVNYITRLNLKFYEYAEKHDDFYICDINYISSSYGLDKWSNEFYWYMYKYAMDVLAIPYLAFNVSNIIKAIFGKNKKGFVLDLDNTLWGGIVGDDGVENLAIGPEVAIGESYSEFQAYLKEYKNLGIILNIDSKNDYENAIAGLNHAEGVLKPEDFISIKANWDPKSKNLVDIANELNLGVDSLVFVDDNPAEREIIRQQVKGATVPEITVPEEYIKIIDKSGFFEVTKISSDDLEKSKMYKENAERNNAMMTFSSYDDYLESLEMKAEIKPFSELYMSRISQLTNKSNQFNLTTKRYTQSEIKEISKNDNYIDIYGKLEDKFGDNGVVSVVIGNKKGDNLDIDLWLMSCRVLKRDMEFAMMDTLVEKAKMLNISTINGYYYPTAKNNMVKEFYKDHGFEKISEDDKGNTVWTLKVENYKNKNKFIKVED